MTSPDDWRLHGFGDFSTGLPIRHKQYSRWSERWDHDHCIFCWTKFTDPDDPSAIPGTQHAGYAIAAHTFDGQSFPDDYDWICETCYEDLKDRFQWDVIDE